MNSRLILMSLLVGFVARSFAQVPDSLWSVRWGGPGADHFNAVATTSSGDFVLAGYTQTVDHGQDILLARVSASGQLLWSQALGGTGDQVATSVLEDAQHRIVIAGYDGSYYWGTPIMLCTDSIGNFLWSQQYPDTCMFLDFDGIDDYIEIPDSPLLDFGPSSDFTVAVRLRASTLTSCLDELCSGLVAKAGIDPYYGFQLTVRNHHLSAEIRTGNVWVEPEGSADLTDDQWHTVALCVSRSSHLVRLFMDGELQHELDISSIGDLSNEFPLYIGATRELGRIFRGSISEVQLLDEDRSDTGGSLVDAPTSHTVAMWKFDEGQGTVLHDYSGNGLHGTIQGAVWSNCEGVSQILGGSFWGLREVPAGGYVAVGIDQSYDGLVIHTDAAGNLMWTRAIQGSCGGWDQIQSVDACADGGLIVAGGFDFCGADIFVAKLDSAGATEWSHNFAFPSGDWADVIRSLPDGGYIVGGHSQSFGNDMQLVVMRLDANGDSLWTRVLGGPGSDSWPSIVVMPDGDFTVAASYDNANTFGKFYLARLTPTGELRWERTFESGTDYAHTMLAGTHDGGFALAGSTDRYGAAGRDAYLLRVAGDFCDDFDNLGNWDLFGDPLPVWVASIHGRDGVFDNNGDPSYNSGAISKWDFPLTDGFTIESDVYLDFYNPNGCWAEATIGISDNIDSEIAGYGTYVTFWLQAVGNACGASPEVSGHACFYASYLSECGWRTHGYAAGVGPFYLADEFANGWHELKIVVDTETHIPGFYADDQLVIQGTAPVADLVLQQQLPLYVGQRSSGSAGKAYNDKICFRRGGTASVYPQPYDLVVQPIGASAQLSWRNAVSCESGVTYLVYYETDPQSEFEFLALTTDTFYTHPYVVQFAPQMFYEVTSYFGPVAPLLNVISELGGHPSRSQLRSRLTSRPAPPER